MTAAEKRFRELFAEADVILVVQANNLDGDSLGSALALESIGTDLNKTVHLYCAGIVPDYLKFIPGWDRVLSSLPGKVDLIIVVDNSSESLLTAEIAWPKAPLVILDHHPTTPTLTADVVINDPGRIATGELIWHLAQVCKWPLAPTTAELLATAILSDSLGLTSQAMAANPRPLLVLADLVESGADLAALSQRRLAANQIDADVVAYKGRLLGRIEWCHHNQIAVLEIEPDDIKEYGGRYNPTVILDELRTVAGLKLSLGFKKYFSHNRLDRVTVRIRCFGKTRLAQDLAEAFGGGGHPYAAGAKWQAPDLDFNQIKAAVVSQAETLIDAATGTDAKE